MKMDEIKIGPIVYKIKYDSEIDKNANLNGAIRYNDALIVMNEGMDEQIERQVLWHEALHALMTQSKIDHDERMTDLLAYGIMQLLQDNPELKE